MMVLFSGRERTLEEWKELFGKASPRLEIESIACPDGSALSILEVKMQGQQ